MEPTARLSENEKRILQVVNRYGYTASVIIQAKTGVTENVVQNSLDTLYRTGLVVRPYRGLVVSQEWIDKNPHKASELENNLKIRLV